MDLTKDTAISGITEVGKGMPDDSGRDAGMDANTNNRPNKNGTKLARTDSQACICHATSTTTTKEPNTKGDTTPIDIDALEPGSPESPIYVDALECPPSPSS